MARWIVQGRIEPLSVDGERITPDKWEGSVGRPIRRVWPAVAVVAALAVVPPPDTNAESVSVDRWRGHEGRIVRRVPAGYAFADIDTSALTQPETASIDRWLGHEGRIVRRLTPGHYAFDWDATAFAQAESVSIDRFDGSRLHITRRKIGGSASSELEISDIPVSVTVAQWLGSVGKAVLRVAPSGRGSSDVDSTALTAAEFVSFDKFAPDWFEFARRRKEPGKAFLDIDPAALTTAEEIIISKWYSDRMMIPWRSIRKPHPTRDWYATSAVISLPDVYNSSTDPVIDKRTTRAVVRSKTTQVVIERKKTRKP